MGEDFLHDIGCQYVLLKYVVRPRSRSEGSFDARSMVVKYLIVALLVWLTLNCHDQHLPHRLGITYVVCWYKAHGSYDPSQITLSIPKLVVM